LTYRNVKAKLRKTTVNDALKSQVQTSENAYRTRIEYQLFIYGVILFIAMLPLAIAEVSIVYARASFKLIVLFLGTDRFCSYNVKLFNRQHAQ
jgi:hypothetical protein